MATGTPSATRDVIKDNGGCASHIGVGDWHQLPVLFHLPTNEWTTGDRWALLIMSSCLVADCKVGGKTRVKSRSETHAKSVMRN